MPSHQTKGRSALYKQAAVWLVWPSTSYFSQVWFVLTMGRWVRFAVQLHCGLQLCRLSVPSALCQWIFLLKWSMQTLGCLGMIGRSFTPWQETACPELFYQTPIFLHGFSILACPSQTLAGTLNERVPKEII